ncbi:hypothetical protein P175DRAFT_0473594 [Aspergillus ochraceoroseus IBT 24754]|uniref:HMG box domain-containing protein n=2 Tax=Aspergillus ochraceoroseus TaxID=138278 RepID=A0A2T5M1T7_9EURO|nr:uncharacterized protein P175DRAFT_0473594 [Aspergillus ochraceoroseus IBT 24754]KKK16342.1 hypothetical protein AOCH_002348 [Aspergillus ochraceoroseus]PTU22500.1 hypothetical protein P175DRAFT_0473594 [Aspergillus ochraceoroseus IBT 24754]
MPLNLVRRGGFFRHLHVKDAFTRPVRVIASQSHIRRVSFVVHRPFSRASIIPNAPRSSLIVSNLIRTYATAGRPKVSTGAKTTKTKQKAAPKKKVKKELTEAQKEKKKAKDFNKLVRELKKTALQPPKKLPSTPWTLAVTSKIPEAQQTTKTPGEAFKKATELAQTISAEERERFVEQANANKAANKTAYDEWIQEHTPLQIKEANIARRRLARIKDTSLSLLRDDRLVKRPNSPYIYFFKERHEAGDLKYMAAADLSARVAEEWRGLTDTEKQKYNDLFKADRERYDREYRDVYGLDPPAERKSS